MLKLSILLAIPLAMLAQLNNYDQNPTNFVSLQNQQIVDTANKLSDISLQVTQIEHIATQIAQNASQKPSEYQTTETIDLLEHIAIQLASTQNIQKPEIAKATNEVASNAMRLVQIARNQDLSRIAVTANQVARIANQASKMLANSSISDQLAAAPLNEIQMAQVQQLVIDTLAQNPQLIVKSLAKAQTKKPAWQSNTMIQAKRDEIFSQNNQLVLGNPNADVTIVEFNDYNCKYCKQMSSTLKEALKLDPNLKVMIKETPVVSPESKVAAKAAVAAKRQGQYNQFRNLLATANQPTNLKFLSKIAQTLGLNQASFQSDLESPAISEYLTKNIKLAQSLGFETTPTIIISKNNGQFSQVVSGAIQLTKLQTLINNVRNNKMS